MIKAERSYKNSETNHPLVPGHIPELNTQPHSQESLQNERQTLLKCNKSPNNLFSITALRLTSEG
jgi:hypothetical protein